MFEMPTQRQAGQYAMHLKRVGKFRLKTWSGDNPPYSRFVYLLDRIGWEMSGVSALALDNTVYIKDWYNIDPLSKIRKLNHECKHIAQIRKYGWERFALNYAAVKEFRFGCEVAAYQRNMQVNFMFGIPLSDGMLNRRATKMKTTYLLDNSHVKQSLKIFKTTRARLKSGTIRNDSATFWRAFLRSKNKRQASPRMIK